MKKTTKIVFSLFICVNITGQNIHNNDIFSDSIAFAKYIYTNMHYPLIDFVNNIEGTAVYQFKTDSIGRKSEMQLDKSSGSKTLDTEARRLIYAAPMKQTGRNSIHKVSIDFKLSDNKIHHWEKVEKKPEFPGGDDELMKFIVKNLKWPPGAAEMSIQGRIICGLVIEKDGSIGAVEIIEPLYYLLDAEALRLVRSMPKWTAGKQAGNPVRVYILLPIRFKLQT
jgi:TonB family protein